ncbi:hypothetical protein PIB30_045098 [Stylosanthes scabra]|uniref:Uncharacterized protein n=1 Tax=Stylosanthes scabra TaxID=79078 RepID=A0ABU6ZET2_9FABA|nr:hypothetical protein [Stylosanthes scabra]
MVVQRGTRGRQMKKAGEGTSSGSHGSEGMKEKIPTTGTRFAVLNSEDPNVIVVQQQGAENVSPKTTKQGANPDATKETHRRNNNSTKKPSNLKTHQKDTHLERTCQPTTPETQPTTTPGPTSDPHIETNQPPNPNHPTNPITNQNPSAQPNHNHIPPPPPTTSTTTNLTQNQNHNLHPHLEPPISPMDLIVVPETTQMDEDVISGPDPKPPDDLHSIDTNIMLEVVCQYEA